jgi:hypothetical protein
MAKNTSGGAATPKKPAAKTPVKEAQAKPGASKESFDPLGWVGGFVAGALSFIGLGPTNPYSAAPRDFVRLKSADLMHAVETDADETREQGKAYMAHVARVVDTRNRLKTNAIQDARHTIDRWEALADQAATRIEHAAPEKQADMSAKEMLALITQVETEFRALVPSDIMQMAADVSNIIKGGGDMSAIIGLVDGIQSTSKTKRRRALAMAGADEELTAEMDNPAAIVGTPTGAAS